MNLHAERGRLHGLPFIAGDLRGHAAAACRRLDHPGLNRGLFDEDAFLLPEGSDGVSGNAQGLMPIVGHVERLQRYIVEQITLPLRPILKEVDSIFQGRYLPNQILRFLKIDRSIEQLRDHSYLTDFVGDQQGKRWGQRRFFICDFNSLASRGTMLGDLNETAQGRMF